jgi:hypothetical protein
MIDGNFVYVKALQWTTGISSLNIELETRGESCFWKSLRENKALNMNL